MINSPACYRRLVFVGDNKSKWRGRLQGKYPAMRADHVLQGCNPGQARSIEVAPAHPGPTLAFVQDPLDPWVCALHPWYQPLYCCSHGPHQSPFLLQSAKFNHCNVSCTLPIQAVLSLWLKSLNTDIEDYLVEICHRNKLLICSSAQAICSPAMVSLGAALHHIYFFTFEELCKYCINSLRRRILAWET